MRLCEAARAAGFPGEAVVTGPDHMVGHITGGGFVRRSLMRVIDVRAVAAATFALSDRGGGGNATPMRLGVRAAGEQVVVDAIDGVSAGA